MIAVPVHVRHSNLLGSLTDEEVGEILSACRSVRLGSGESACREGEAGVSMFVIVSGRVSIHVDEPGGKRRIINHLKPGDHFGEMSLLVGGARSATVTAVIDTELLELTRPDFERSLARVPGFAANLCRSLGEWLRGQITGGRRHERMQVALVRGCTVAGGLAAQLATQVADEGGELQVFSDQAPCLPVGRWRTMAPADGESLEPLLLAALSEAVARNERTLVDIDPSQATPALLMQHELVWWVVDGDHDERRAALERLRDLLADAPPGLTRRMQLVQAIRTCDKLPRPIDLSEAALAETLGHPPIRVEFKGPPSAATFHARDKVRLVRQMRGIQLGLALGGGGARGIAHIGVLEVFEREGIYFDRVAGTSAGAIVAAAYAAGIPLSRVRDVFEKEMTPPAAIAWLPKARQWYMLAVYRLGMAEVKFRRHLHHYDFSQLLLPAQLVTVDLISGEPRIRSAGDVVNAVLESVNHPVFGAPILRDGEVLVDGGVLMNLPVSALRQEQVDFSVAVNVSKKLSREFAGNTRETPSHQMRRPGYLSTLLRVTDIELSNLAALQGAQCDFLLAPDTANFPFDDFGQAEGLMQAGREAAEAEVPRLREALRRTLGWDRGQPQTADSDQHRDRRAA